MSEGHTLDADDSGLGATTSGGLLKVAEAFSELGRLIGKEPGSALDALLAVAVQQVRGSDFASITNHQDGTFRTLASTDRRANHADDLQYQLGGGPCVDAILVSPLYRPRDLRQDPRWPEFGRQVSSLGVLSMLSYRLQLDPDHGVGSLNLYSTAADAFDDETVVVGLLLATHGGMAVAAARSQAKVADLTRALRSNRLIGTAMGILMAEHKVTREQAFDLLSIASQHANRKLADIAEDVVATGLLDVGGSGGGTVPS